MKAEDGCKVKVEYTGSFENGEVFDASEKHGQPLEFQIGAKMVVPGFEKAVTGMEEGEEKEFTLTPAEAYGDIRPELVQKVPKDKLPGEAKEGMIIGVGLPNGAQIPAKITQVGESEITIDLNHPLAGKTLKFKIKLVGVEKAEKKEEPKEAEPKSEASTEEKNEEPKPAEPKPETKPEEPKAEPSVQEKKEE